MNQVIPTRPTVFAAIRRWFARREVAQRMAGIQQAIESIETELDELQAFAFGPPEQAICHVVRAEALKRERMFLMRDFDQLERAYKAL